MVLALSFSYYLSQMVLAPAFPNGFGSQLSQMVLAPPFPKVEKVEKVDLLIVQSK